MQHLSVAHKDTHLVSRETKHSSDEEPLNVSTPPVKWPGMILLLLIYFLVLFY